MSMVPKFSTLTVMVDGPRGDIRLNRPEKLNAISETMLHELVEAAHFCDARSEIKVVVISGAGRSFSAGADVTMMDAPVEPTSVSRSLTQRRHLTAEAGSQTADAIEGMEAVTVCQLHGHCVGGGAVLASACDIRVAAEGTIFSIPELFLGIPLAWGGIPRLVRDVGAAKTKELVMTGRRFGAAEAAAAGLVNRVVPEERLEEEVRLLVDSLLDKSMFTLGATKRYVNAVAEHTVDLGRAWNDAHSLEAALRDPESRAARTSYLERFRTDHQRSG